MTTPASANAPATRPPRADSVIEIAWRRKSLVAGVFFVAVTGSAVALMIIPKRVTAQARVEVSRNVPYAGDAKNADLNTFLNTQVELIKSASVLEPALDGPGVAAATAVPHDGSEITFLKRELDVAPKNGASLLLINFAATNPTEAQAVVNSVAQAYVAHIAAQKDNTAMEDFNALREQRSHLDKDRIDAESLLSTLRSETGVTAGAPESPAVAAAMGRVEELNKQFNADQAETGKVEKDFSDALIGLNYTLEKYDAEKLAAATAVSPQSLDLLRNNLGALSQQLIEAKRQFVPTHPAVRNLQGQIRDMQTSQAATLRAMYAAAQARETKSREMVEAQNKLVANLNKKAGELVTASAKLDSLKTQIAQLDDKLTQLTLVETVGISARQMDAAEVLLDSAVPNTWKTLGIASVIGLVLGMMAALIREWISPALGSVHRLAETVGVALLGTLPWTAGRTPRELAMTTHEHSDSEAAEAFRSVRTSMLFSAAQCQTIAVTSPAAKDGKTTLATNLAISLAQSGKRVLLVDANFKDPTLHTLFDSDNGIGFSGVLNGDDLESSLRRTPIEHLDLLTAGPRTSDISEQLNSNRFSDLLRDLHVRYDHVIFDAANVSASNDARVIAAGVDQTVLVVRGEKSNRYAVSTARDALLSVGANLMGIVVNAAQSPAYPTAGERRDKSAASAGEQFARLRSGR